MALPQMKFSAASTTLHDTRRWRCYCALLLLVECVGCNLVMDDVVVRDADAPAVAGGGKANLIGYFSLTMVSLLDRTSVQTLYRYHGLSRIAMDRVLLIIKFRIIALAIPMQAELIIRHLIRIGTRRIVCLLQRIELRPARAIR